MKLHNYFMNIRKGNKIIARCLSKDCTLHIILTRQCNEKASLILAIIYLHEYVKKTDKNVYSNQLP